MPHRPRPCLPVGPESARACPRCGLAGAVLLVLLALLAVAGTAVASRTELGRPGYLVISGVRDTTLAGVFVAQEGPGPGRHALVWPEGTLSLPDSLVLEAFGAADVGLPCGPALSGVGGSGRLVFQDGIYEVSEPLVLADGILELHVSEGTLEMRGDQIRYRRPDPEARRDKAQIIFLAGLVLLIVVLLRRVRHVARSR